MKKDLPHIKILKIVLGIVGCFLAVFVYSFMGSRFGGESDMSAEAYGYESLEYTGEPVMQICVWQRNERRIEDYPWEDFYSPAFFDAVPLELKEGASISTNEIPVKCDPVSWEVIEGHYNELNDDIVITATFDGIITGEYDEIRYLRYSSNLSEFPNGIVTNENGQVHGTDGTFTKPEKIILNFDSDTDLISRLWIHHIFEDERRGNEHLLRDRELYKGLDYDDFTEVERYTDVYPDADEKWKSVKRSVLTSYVTIRGADPIKPDVILCEAVLELKSYSAWIYENLEYSLQGEFIETMLENPTTVVTVVSYTQSDKFAE